MIICFSGLKGSGKDTLAAYLIEKYKAVRVSFADPLKDLVAEEYGIDRASLDDPNRKEKPILTLPVEPKDAFTRMVAEFMYKEFAFADGKKANGFFYFGESFMGNRTDLGNQELYHTPRSLAILKGSTNRVVRSDFWVQKACDAIQDNLDKGSLVVISDLRYKSEMAQLTERFGKEVVFVRINRHKESTSMDPSEMDLVDSKFDYYIDNSDHLNYTYAQLENLLRSVQNAVLDELAVETEKLGLEFK
jgi:hypothetical protein